MQQKTIYINYVYFYYLIPSHPSGWGWIRFPNMQEKEKEKGSDSNTIDSRNIITAEKENFLNEIREKIKNKRPLEAGRQKTKISVNLEKLKMLKEVMIRQQEGIVLALDDFNNIFDANLTNEIKNSNGRFYNYKRKINELTKDAKDKRGIWLENSDVEGYVEIALK